MTEERVITAAIFLLAVILFLAVLLIWCSVAGAMAPDDCTLSVIVFDDANGNGWQEPGEAGLPQRLVTVESSYGSKRLLTDSQGGASTVLPCGTGVRLSWPWSMKKTNTWLAAVAEPLPVQPHQQFLPSQRYSRLR